MQALLNPVEARVLGALVEKQITTPDYYPLTLNGLTTACNQKSNRFPVVAFDEKTVVRAQESLRDKELARMVSGADMRVPKYYHLFVEKFELTPPQVAALCVLMLRGPQTTGEIRGRSSRLYEFADLGEVDESFRAAATYEGQGEWLRPMYERYHPAVKLDQYLANEQAFFSHSTVSSAFWTTLAAMSSLSSIFRGWMLLRSIVGGP